MRGLLGAWSDRPHEAGLLARRLALAMARLALGEGRDVVVPQFLARPAFIGELEALAGELGAEFVEVVLVEAPDVAAARLAQRAAGPMTAVQRDAHLMLDRAGGLDTVPELHRRLQRRARRPPRRAAGRAGARRRRADLSGPARLPVSGGTEKAGTVPGRDLGYRGRLPAV